MTLTRLFARVPVVTRWADRFQGLDWRDPALWPRLPRAGLGLLVALGVALPAGWLLAARAGAELAAEREREPALRQALRAKLAQAAQLGPLQQRREALQAQVAAQQERLPPPGQLDALLAALHQAARRHGLQVDLIRPEAAQPRAHLAAMPIALRLSGRYHALGAFIADLGALEPPVTLHALHLSAGTRDALATLDATALAYRRLDAGEATRAAAAGAPGAGARAAAPPSSTTPAQRSVGPAGEPS